jgi:hypothetical protein
MKRKKVCGLQVALYNPYGPRGLLTDRNCIPPAWPGASQDRKGLSRNTLSSLITKAIYLYYLFKKRFIYKSKQLLLRK